VDIYLSTDGGQTFSVSRSNTPNDARQTVDMPHLFARLRSRFEQYFLLHTAAMVTIVPASHTAGYRGSAALWSKGLCVGNARD